MSQFDQFESKHYSRTARSKGFDVPSLQDHQMDQSLDNETNTFDQNRSTRKNKSLLGKSSQGATCWCPAQAQKFNKTSGKLLSASFRHHDPNMCVCESCTCGRHLCKFKNVTPDLSKASVYKMSYDKKEPIPNNINRAGEYGKLDGPHLDLGTNYNKFYDGKKGDPNERPRPEDLLKTGGPLQNLTSYSSGFPGHKGPNQYVKPTDNMIRADFPMMSRSTYANAFVGKSAPKPVIEKIPDNLKSGNIWMGKTTYGNFFQQPNPEDYAKRNKNQEKLDKNPDYGRQYETTYKNSFLGPAPAVCPAKIALETKAKGFFNSSKQKFAENTDYKALNPTFHAISTSKHSYV